MTDLIKLCSDLITWSDLITLWSDVITTLWSDLIKLCSDLINSEYARINFDTNNTNVTALALRD